MATVINKDKIQVDATLYPGQVLLANNLPVVTTDEVAVEINTSYDALGNETVTGFNTLTDKLAYIDQSIAQIPSLSINNTSSTEFTVCGGNDSGSDPHTVSLINDISLNGSTLNVSKKILNFKTLHSTLSSILSRLSDLENGSSGSTPKASISNPGDKIIKYNTTQTIFLTYTGLSTISVSSSNSNIIEASISNSKLSLKAKKSSGSAYISIYGEPSTHYLAPDVVRFTATADKAPNTITISPSVNIIDVVNGLYDGNSYYTTIVSTAAGTDVYATSDNSDKVYFREISGSSTSAIYVNNNAYLNIYFGALNNLSGSATITLSSSGDSNYLSASEKITFNFSNNSSSNYKYYLGVNPESIITNTSSVNYLISGSGAQTATSKHTEITWPASDDSGLYQLYIYPTAWGTIKGLTNKSDNKPIGFMTYSDLDITPPTGYAVIAISDAKRFGGTTSVITW